jgi:hypothetical protein
MWSPGAKVPDSRLKLRARCQPGHEVDEVDFRVVGTGALRIQARTPFHERPGRIAQSQTEAPQRAVRDQRVPARLLETGEVDPRCAGLDDAAALAQRHGRLVYSVRH